MIILIGNAPSSGSTLLADLMDAVPGFACGPESRLFCHKSLYSNFEQAKKRAFNFLGYSTPQLSVYRQTFQLKEPTLQAFGLDKGSLKSNLQNNATFKEFITSIKHNYLELRGEDRYTWVEKTPENIHTAGQFLNLFEEGYFIHIVRDPLYVYHSVRKNRKKPSLVSLASWLTDVAAGYQFRKHPRYIEIKYSDLVASPYETISSLAKKINGQMIDPQSIAANYRQNTYRQQNEIRIKSWGISEYGEIKNADEKKIPKSIISAYDSFGKIKVGKKFALLHDIPQVSMDELCEYYGFQPPAKDRKPNSDIRSTLHLTTKFLFDYLYGSCNLTDLDAYMKPIESSEFSA